MMNDDQFKILVTNQELILKSLDRMHRDMSDDHKGDQELLLIVGAMKNQLEQLRSGQATMANRIKDKVEDIVEPLAANIAKKRVMIVKGESWIKRIFRR